MVWRNPQLILNGFAHLANFFAKSIRVPLEGFSGHGVDFWVWDPCLSSDAVGNKACPACSTQKQSGTGRLLFESSVFRLKYYP